MCPTRVATAVGAAAGALLLSACASSENSAACTAYEAAYNELADTIRTVNAGEGETADALAAAKALPDGIEIAAAAATGEVAREMQASLEAARTITDDTTGDAALAYFLTAPRVAEACAADGAAIELHETE